MAVLGHDFHVLVFSGGVRDGGNELGFSGRVNDGSGAARAAVGEGAVGVGNAAVGVAGLAIHDGLRRGAMNVQK